VEWIEGATNSRFESPTRGNESDCAIHYTTQRPMQFPPLHAVLWRVRICNQIILIHLDSLIRLHGDGLHSDGQRFFQWSKYTYCDKWVVLNGDCIGSWLVDRFQSSRLGVINSDHHVMITWSTGVRRRRYTALLSCYQFRRCYFSYRVIVNITNGGRDAAVTCRPPAALNAYCSWRQITGARDHVRPPGIASI